MNNKLMKVSSWVMIIVGAIGILNSFPATLIIMISIVSPDFGLTPKKVLLWVLSILVLSIGELYFGLKLLNKRDAKHWHNSLCFQIAYIIIFNIILTVSFGKDFLKAYGFIGASIIPLIIIALLLFTKKKKKSSQEKK